MKHFTWLVICIIYGTFTVASAQDCPEGLINDCNGYCVPMEWLIDDICDDGTAQEYPVGSGYYVDFSCESFYCDIFNCTGCEGGCPAGFVPDCNGNCAPAEWVADGICDYGQREYNGVAIVFSCQAFNCDIGDCSGPCWADGDFNGGTDIGACCINGVCSEISRNTCWGLSGIFIGANTICQTGTCGCGEGWITDCNGNCINLLDFDEGGVCQDGSWVDYGNGPFQISVNCVELACGLSNCLGICPGGCCVDGGCELTSTYQTCLDLGGLFLGSNSSCEEGAVDCVSQQKPIQLPDSEIEWSGLLGTVEFVPQWLMSKGNILIAGATKQDLSWDMKTAVCVYRYDVDQWVEEALLIMPSGIAGFSNDSYTTDGNRIAVGSKIEDAQGQRFVIDIFVYDQITNVWLFEQTIDDGYQSTLWEFTWGSSIAIDGEVLIVGDPSLNDTGNNNGGGAHVYRFNGTAWSLSTTLLPFGTPPYPEGEDQFLGLSVAIEDGVVALCSTSSLLLYDINTATPTNIQHLRNMWGNFFARHRSIDIDNGRLMSNVTFRTTEDLTLVSRIYENIGGTWTETAELKPFDFASSDQAGHIVDLQGNYAIITSPADNDLGLETGSAYIWKYDGTNWVFQSKLWSDRAVGGDLFGVSATLHGSSAYVSGLITETEGDSIKVFSDRGIVWINPLGGLMSDATNWDPIKPTSTDVVSFSLRSQTLIVVDEALPFQQMFVGPGKFIFDLQGVDRAFGTGGEALNLQGVSGMIAELEIQGGVLNITGTLY
ncbi:MAG TPA: hypothetical protein EYN32_00685, partial [Phycisphaerales bacterium]|nr:hypothetical protein [Phycisphaerales bacterium]